MWHGVFYPELAVGLRVAVALRGFSACRAAEAIGDVMERQKRGEVVPAGSSRQMVKGEVQRPGETTPTTTTTTTPPPPPTTTTT